MIPYLYRCVGESLLHHEMNRGKTLCHIIQNMHTGYGRPSLVGEMERGFRCVVQGGGALVALAFLGFVRIGEGGLFVLGLIHIHRQSRDNMVVMRDVMKRPRRHKE